MVMKPSKVREHKFRKISLHNGLITKVEEVMKAAGSYRSIAEFISEATRLHCLLMSGDVEFWVSFLERIEERQKERA